MPLPIIETCRKRKRRPSVYSLHRLGEEEFPVSRSGSFRDNVRVFLRDFAEVEDYSIRGSPVWCTLLSHEAKSSVIPLYTIEEDVVRSSEPFCDHCRCTDDGEGEEADSDSDEEEEEEGDDDDDRGGGHIVYEPTGDRTMEDLRDNITNEYGRGRLPY
ncbi:hypothetical protein Bca101_027049 [Brassica carinata]